MPLEQELRRPEKQQVGIDHEFPAGRAEVRVDQFAEIGIILPALAQRREAGRGQLFVEALLHLGFRDDPAEGEKLEQFCGVIAERAVVVDDGRERSFSMPGEGPETERCLIPESVAGQEMEVNGFVDDGRRCGQPQRERFHFGATAFGAAAFERPAVGDQIAQPAGRTMPGVVESFAGD